MRCFGLPLCVVLCLAGWGFAADPAPVPVPDLEFDYTKNQSEPRPAPEWVRMVDLGEQNPALKGYSAPAGVKVEIVATEPALVNPVGMRFSEDGTLYVVEWRAATQSKAIKTEFVRQDGVKVSVDRMWKDSGDVLKVLRDKDGDGKYETAEVVMNDLEMPSSILFHGGWAYFGSVGHVIRRKLEGAPGAKPIQEEILRGYCGYHHHQNSGVTVGHDGWLYVTAGDNDNRVEGSDGSTADVLRTGVITRSTVEGRNVSEFARGFRNPFRDVVFDENFNMFHVDNDQEDGSKFQGVRLLHVVEGGDYGWRLLPGVICCKTDFDRCAVSGELPGKLPAMLKTGRGSPAGLLHYTGRAFPKFFQGMNIYPDVYRKLVRGYFFEPKGGTFRVSQELTLLQSSDDYFRPVHAVMGPDGAIYVLDWRTNSGGAGKLWGDAQHGRLYRLSWEGTVEHPAVARESLQSWEGIARLDDAQLLEVLRTGDFERRQRAQGVLEGRGERVRGILLALLGDSAEPRVARIHALGAVQSFWNGEVELSLVKTLEDSDVHLRRLAADGLGNRLRAADRNEKFGTPSPAPAEGTVAALRRAFEREADLLVKRQMGLALAKIDGARQGDVLLEAWRGAQGQEVFYRDGILRALEACGEKTLQKLIGWLQSEEQGVRAGALNAFDALRSKEAFKVLCAAIDQCEKLSGEERGRLFLSYRNYQFLEPISAEPVVRWLKSHPKSSVPDRRTALQAISMAGGSSSPELLAMLLEWIDSDSEELRGDVIAQIRISRLKAAGDKLARLLVSEKTATAEKQEILKALGELQSAESVPVLKQLAGAAGPLQGDALQTLFVVDPKEAQGVARQVVTSSQDVGLLTTAVNILGSSVEGAKFTGELLRAGKLPRGLLPVVSEVLRNNVSRDPELGALLRDLLKGALLVSLDPAEVKKVEDQVRLGGNPKRGLRVFMDQSKVRCIGCHKLEGIGGQIGPDLTRIWETHSITKIMESIIEPSKEVKEGYQTYLLETKNGLVHVGLKTVETPEGVTIRDSQGKDVRVPREEIEELKADPKSVMPDDVIALLKYQEFIDLVAFLKDRKTQEDLRTGYQWWVVGTYPRKIFDVFPPEKNPDPKTTVPGADGAPRSWVPADQRADGFLNLREVLDAEDISAYALTYVYSPREQQVELRTGSDDALRVWLNDVRVIDYPDNRLSAPDQDRANVTLKQGWNRVLAKVTNNRDKHLLYLRFFGGEGLRFSREMGSSAGK